LSGNFVHVIIIKTLVPLP